MKIGKLIGHFEKTPGSSHTQANIILGEWRGSWARDSLSPDVHLQGAFTLLSKDHMTLAARWSMSSKREPLSLAHLVMQLPMHSHALMPGNMQLCGTRSLMALASRTESLALSFSPNDALTGAFIYSSRHM